MTGKRSSKSNGDFRTTGEKVMDWLQNPPSGEGSTSHLHQLLGEKPMSINYCPVCQSAPIIGDEYCPGCHRSGRLDVMLKDMPKYEGIPLTKRNVLECDNRQDEDEYAIHDLTIRLSEMTLLKEKYVRTINSLRDHVEYLEKGIAEWQEESAGHKANYEYMAKRAAEQQQEIEASNAALGYARDNIAALKAEVERLTMQYKQATGRATYTPDIDIDDGA